MASRARRRYATLRPKYPSISHEQAQGASRTMARRARSRCACARRRCRARSWAPCLASWAAGRTCGSPQGRRAARPAEHALPTLTGKHASHPCSVVHNVKHAQSEEVHVVSVIGSDAQLTPATWMGAAPVLL